MKNTSIYTFVDLFTEMQKLHSNLPPKQKSTTHLLTFIQLVKTTKSKWQSQLFPKWHIFFCRGITSALSKIPHIYRQKTPLLIQCCRQASQSKIVSMIKLNGWHICTKINQFRHAFFYHYLSFFLFNNKLQKYINISCQSLLIIFFYRTLHQT